MANDVTVIVIPDSNVAVVGIPDNGEGSSNPNPLVDWFSGDGPPPDSLIGSGPGDMYVDNLSGTLYQLR